MININLKSGGKFPVDLIWLPMLTRSGPHVSQIDLIKRKPYPSSPGADKLVSLKLFCQFIQSNRLIKCGYLFREMLGVKSSR